MKIKTLLINNFKGIKEFSCLMDGENFCIYGPNASGKSSVYDAYCWLMYGRDSKGNAEFAIKPRDEEGNVIHSLETSVFIEFFDPDSDRYFSLEKKYKEKWTKLRGTKTPTLTGHTTVYLKDNIAIKKAEFEKFIQKNFGPKTIIQQLSDISYFLDGMHWSDRKDVLLQMNDVDVEAVLAESEFEPIRQYLQDDVAPDAVRKTLRKKIATIKQEMDVIATRIDEVLHNLEQPEISEDEIKDQIIQLQDKIAELKIKIQDIQGEDTHVLEDEIKSLRQKINAIKQDNKSKEKQYQVELQAMLDKRDALELRQQELKDVIAWTEAEIAKKTEILNDLRQEWESISQSPDSKICPTCGQEIGEQAWRKIIGQKLAAINEKGKQAKALKEELERKLEKHNKQTIEINEKLEEIKTPEPPTLTDYSALEAKIQTLEQEIEATNSKSGSLALIQDLSNEIEENRKKIKELEELAYQWNRVKSAKQRTEELKGKHKALTQEYENLEHLIYLLEQYERTKARLIEASVNSHFEDVSFKLFEEQLNGGMKEICEPYIKGVPYKDANTAAQINAGLECIEVLSTLYGKNLPVWVDRAESVIELRAMPNHQHIILMVKDNEKLETKKLLS